MIKQKFNEIQLNSNEWGSKYYIDSYIADVYLFNKEDGNIIGRPLVYLAIDVCSKLISGIYVDLYVESESKFFDGVKNVIYNCLEDKTEFCKKFNIELTDEWQVKGIPQTILINMGQISGFELNNISVEFNINIENILSYRKYRKRNLEQICKRINNNIKNQPDQILDIYEFTKVVIYKVLENNKYYIKNYSKIQEWLKDPSEFL